MQQFRRLTLVLMRYLQALTVVIPEGISAVYENTTAKEDHDGHAGEHDHSSHDNSQWIGLALVAGFILMCVE